MPLVIQRKVRDTTSSADNCIVLDLLDGNVVRVWLTRGNGRDRVKVLIDAPDNVTVRRGEHLAREIGVAS